MQLKRCFLKIDAALTNYDSARMRGDTRRMKYWNGVFKQWRAKYIKEFNKNYADRISRTMGDPQNMPYVA